MENASLSPVVYIPGLPSLSSDELALYTTILSAHMNLVTQLSGNGYRVDEIGGKSSWLKTMLQDAANSDAFIFPPMTSLPESHPRFQAEAAKRWFEFFSVVTGIHVGNDEKYSKSGIAKPCVIIDPDQQWSLAINLLSDLHAKGMFTSRVGDIVHVVNGERSYNDYHALNREAVHKLGEVLQQGRGKAKKDIQARYGADHEFKPFRNDINRHPFGVAVFGSATTEEASYKRMAHQTGFLTALRGWRMSTGAGVGGCMGAADDGFNEGKKEFARRYPKARFSPAHVGVSTNPILRLEGPPPHADQLIITDDIYNRMEIIIQGSRKENPLLRTRDATRVIFFAPGGTGTMHEFAALLQLKTSGSMMKGRKIVLLNPPSHINPNERFWDPLIATGHKLGFDKFFAVAHTPDQAMAIADDVYSEWLKSYSEYADLPHPLLNPRGLGFSRS